MQLLGADIDIPGQDIVRDDILDEGALVMLFLVVRLGKAQGDLRHAAGGGGGGVCALHERRKAEGRIPALQRHKRLSVMYYNAIRHGCNGGQCLGQALTDQCGVVRGNDAPLRVDYAERKMCRICELFHYALKYTT